MLTGVASSSVGSAQPSGLSADAGSAMLSEFSPTPSATAVENARSVSATGVAVPLTTRSAVGKREVVSMPLAIVLGVSVPTPNAGATNTPRGQLSTPGSCVGALMSIRTAVVSGPDGCGITGCGV